MQPRAHQRISIKHNRKTPIVFDASDPGTGKTAVRVLAYAERQKKLKHKLLVLCPRTIMSEVWRADFFKFAPHLTIQVGTADSRKCLNPQNADVFITNHDAVKWLLEQPKEVLKNFDEIVIDESTAYKNPTSQRSKAAAKLVKRFTYRACLSGTPNSRSILDIWHQALLLDGGKRLGSSFYAFRNHVCVPTQVGPSANAVQWVDKDGAEEAVFDLLSDIVVRHRIDDCVDLPPLHTWSLGYTLSPKQLKLYRQVEESQYALLRGKELTAINAASVATKLLQIASGAVYLDDSTYEIVDTGRYELILDLVEERRHPLVYFLWTHQRDALVKEAEKRKLRYAVIDGHTNDKKRSEYVQNYQAGFYDVLFGHPKSVGHGLTLTRGTSIIWSSPTYDLEWFAQGSIRQRRIGQTEKTENLIVIARDTIDEKAWQIMEGKNKRMQNLLHLFSENTKELTT